MSFEFGDAWLAELEQCDESNERSPEQQLAAAMIADALRDFKLYWHESNANGQVLFENANAYLFVWRDAEWPFSFDNLCEHLKMNADEIRRRLRLWLANQRLAAIKNKERYRGATTAASATDVGLESSRDAA